MYLNFLKKNIYLPYFSFGHDWLKKKYKESAFSRLGMINQYWGSKVCSPYDIIGALRGIFSPIGFPMRNLKYTGCGSDFLCLSLSSCSSIRYNVSYKITSLLHEKSNISNILNQI
jgi:hypothetical protein